MEGDGAVAETEQWDDDEHIADEMGAWDGSQVTPTADATSGPCEEGCQECMGVLGEDSGGGDDGTARAATLAPPGEQQTQQGDVAGTGDGDGGLDTPRRQQLGRTVPTHAERGAGGTHDVSTPVLADGTPATAQAAGPGGRREAGVDAGDEEDDAGEEQDTSDDDGEGTYLHESGLHGAERRTTRRRLDMGEGGVVRNRTAARPERGETGDEWEARRPKGGRPLQMRWRVQRWMNMHAAAMRYNGARWVASASNRRDALLSDARIRAMVTDSDPGLTNEARRRRVRELCERQVEKYTRKMKRADDSRETDDIVEEMRDVLRRTTNGSVIRGIFDVIQRACGRRGREGASKLTEMMGVRPGTQDDIIRGAARVRGEAQWYGQQRHRAGQANPTVAKHVMHEMWEGLAGACKAGEALERACSWESFEAAVVRCQAEKGVGVDGWNAYLLRKSPVNVRRAYWQCLVEMIKTTTFPPEYKRWVAMLAIKGADENPRDLTRRRDLWIVCHGQKIIMRMLNPEYERAAEAGVPLSQAGYARGRGTTEQVLVARLAAEQQMREQKMLCIGFMDCGTFFMSCVRTVQRECEAWMRPNAWWSARRNRVMWIYNVQLMNSTIT